MSKDEEEVIDRGDDINEEEVQSEETESEEEVVAEEEVVDEDYEEEEEKKEPMLPKSRYDSVAAKNRELEAKIAALEEAGKTKEAEAKREEQVSSMEETIADLDIKYADAVKDGDTEAMAQIRKQQREAEREMYRMEMQETGQQSAAQAREQVQLDLTIDAIEENYTQLNPESDTYDQDLVNEIQELRAGFEATGRYSPTQALIRAVKLMVPEAPSSVEKTVEKAAKGDLKKKVAASNAQPPDLDNVGEQGNSGGKTTADPNPMEMTLEDMEALPESTLKRMRGDAF